MDDAKETYDKLNELFQSTSPSSGSANATKIIDCRCELGEGVIFDDVKNCVVWTDIYGKRMHSLNLTTGEHKISEELPKMLCSFGLLSPEKTGYICAFEDGFQLMDDEMKPMSDYSVGEPVNPMGLPTRLNDGRVDPTGNAFIAGGYFGSIDDAYVKVFKCEIDEIIGESTKLKLKHSVLVDKIQTTNSICFSPGGNTMYLADSETSKICKYDYSNGKISLSQGEVVREVSVGVPDGSCTDSKGNIWNAVWRGGSGTAMVDCIDPETKEVLFTCYMPDNTSQVTCCCFGGPDLDILFITTASTGVAEKESSAGSLYACKVNAKGRLEKRFNLK